MLGLMLTSRVQLVQSDYNNLEAFWLVPQSALQGLLCCLMPDSNPRSKCVWDGLA